MDISWAPGHTDIAGNEEADRRAKEAATEASKFKEGSSSTSMAEVNLASTQHIMSLWQRRWDIAEVGREYYKYIPQVTMKRQFDIPTKQAYSRILQLQTGLNLNLNSLLVTRQMTLFHQGVRMGKKLVP